MANFSQFEEASAEASRHNRPGVKNVEQLLAMARDRSREGRAKLIGAMGDLFAGSNDILSARERAIMSDIMCRLVSDVEHSVRRKLAKRLADSDCAPHALVVELANDDISIAAPLLLNSGVLQDVDLIEIIHLRTMEHQLAVAMRDSIAAPVTDALVETGNDTVIEAVLRNPNAAFSPATIEHLVECSRERETYQAPLLQRDELGPDLAKRMYWWVFAALRTAILERYALDADALDDAMEAAVRDNFAESGVAGADAVPETLESLLAIDEVAQNELVRALRNGEVTVFHTLLRKATGLQPVTLRTILFEADGERLAIVCRAIDMSPEVFGAIYRLLRMSGSGRGGVKRGELVRVDALYREIQLEPARIVLRQWRRDPDYVAAIEQVTGIGSVH